MEEFALSCNYEHLVLDIGDKTWGEYFTDEELHELQTFQNKQFEEIPAEVDVYMDSLTQFIDPEDLRSNLKEELKCTSCEWVRWTILGFMKLFDCNYLPLNNQSEGDLLRRVWSFVDSVFDYSKINCIGGEKASKASSASKNKDRTISGKEKMENKVMGRKVDLLFNRQQLEYGCCECGRFEDQIKKFNDGCFKILKALKDMLYGLYKTSSSSVRDFMSIVPNNHESNYNNCPSINTSSKQHKKKTLLKAVSDFLRLLMKELVEVSYEKIKDAEELHRIFIIPSEWEKEMREVLFRPLFVQADLISKDDHKDRLLFCSELEYICYGLMDVDDLERGKNTIVCRLSPIEEDEILIKLDLVSTVNSLFDFSDAVRYPKVVRSNSLYLTTNNITDDVPSIDILSDMDEKDKVILLKQPLIMDTSKWELDKHQEVFMGSICLFNICAKIGESMFNNVMDLLLNDL
ncbi:hypothetical protein INT48_001590, partial [Thamnidium elegans]